MSSIIFSIVTETSRHIHTPVHQATYAMGTELDKWAVKKMAEGMPTCQQCYKWGVKLLKCGGCKVENYCSKACQRAAWPNHKIECPASKVAQVTPNPKTAILCQFANEHKQAIREASARALDLYNYPERAKDHYLVIKVRSRDNYQSPESAFHVTGGGVCSVNGNPFSPAIRRMIQEAYEGGIQIRRKECLGAVMTAVVTEDDRACCFFAFPFSRCMCPETGDWEEVLMATLNQPDGL